MFCIQFSRKPEAAGSNTRSPDKKIRSCFAWNVKINTFVPLSARTRTFFGDVAQLVEQRTENPCVGGSIPSITTASREAFFMPVPLRLPSRRMVFLVKFVITLFPWIPLPNHWPGPCMYTSRN